LTKKKKKLSEWLVDTYSVPGVNEIKLSPNMRHPYTWTHKREKRKKIAYIISGIVATVLILLYFVFMV